MREPDVSIEVYTGTPPTYAIVNGVSESGKKFVKEFYGISDNKLKVSDLGENNKLLKQIKENELKYVLTLAK